MSDEAKAAIDDARAFIDALLQSDWQELHIAHDDFELFIARDNGGPNPMFAGASVEPATPRAVPTERSEIAAPHVATVSWIASMGDFVGAGETAVRLSVLDDEHEVTCEDPSRVVEVLVSEGEMVEYGAPLVVLMQES